MKRPSISLLTLLATALLPGLARAERHPVFSLAANRPLGHLQRRGGLYIEAGGAGMAKYIHFSRPATTAWKLRAVEDKRRVALAQTQATLEVPLTAAQAASKVLYLGLKAPASSVRVAVGDKVSAAVGLKPGWQVVVVPLPEGALKAGETVLHFQFAQRGKFAGQSAAAAVEFIQVGGGAPAAADPIATATDAIVLPSGGGVAWYGYVPAGGGMSTVGEGVGCKLTLRATADGAGPLESEVPLDGGPVDLASLGGRFARIELSAGGGCSALTLKRAALLAGGPAPQRMTATPPRNVIVWLTDDTRADKYKFWNPRSRVETPVFDELAKSSTVFKAAYTQGNESRVSHASLFTSMYPGVHQMIKDTAKLDSRFVILPEAVRPSGRYVAGVMGNGYIDKFWGFGDGWDYLHNSIHEGGGLKADDLLALSKKVLDAHASKPFFLYIGTIDAHVSWRAHEPWLSRYDREPYSGPFVKACLDPQLDKIVLGQLKITERDKTRIQALYDSDISYNDAVLGKLVDDLRKRGILEQTMIIVTSDHGEEMWDHGRIGHGQSIREELIHVPFLVFYPPMFPPGKTIEEGVDVLDVLPTIADALAIETPEGAQGESLIPLAQGVVAGYPRPAIGSQYELAHTMRLGHYKMWVGGGGDARLFDASVDWREDHDLYSTRPVERRALTDALGTWMAFRNQWKKRRWGVASNLLPAFSTDLDK